MAVGARMMKNQAQNGCFTGTDQSGKMFSQYRKTTGHTLLYRSLIQTNVSGFIYAMRIWVYRRRLYTSARVSLAVNSHFNR